MNFLALHDDVKFIISKHIASDLKNRALLSKNHDLQKHYWESSYITMTYVNIKICSINLQYNAKENDDFKNAKLFKIYEDLSNTRDVVCIGSTCDTLSKCMSNFRFVSKSRVNWSYDQFYLMIQIYICICIYMYIHTYKNMYMYI